MGIHLAQNFRGVRQWLYGFWDHEQAKKVIGMGAQGKGGSPCGDKNSKNEGRAVHELYVHSRGPTSSNKFLEPPQHSTPPPDWGLQHKSLWKTFHCQIITGRYFPDTYISGQLCAVHTCFLCIAIQMSLPFKLSSYGVISEPREYNLM